MGLSLEKKSELVKLTLAKRQVPTGIKMSVKAAIDVSGSIRDEFQDGTMQELIDRLLPVAMRFDDNQSLDCYAFGSDSSKVGDITVNDFGNFVRKFLRTVPSNILWSGTSYSRALKLIDGDINPAMGLRSLFSRKKPTGPNYVMFITDGDTQGDEKATELLLGQMAATKTYVQLIGIGNGCTFRFLKDMADQYDHVGFVTFPDLKRTTDEQMYEALLGEELCTWIKKQ